ncbi:hypothetical protein XELAEV_18033838mg [Xenopus laevis]|uniref:Uncharacterized protein n=1 Tax=Xenopus laevis TaxID=8355 RepID=A0A974HES0_XENLA|nr:hypothetical protein XELAEV_18033838mg [Xenopus laevis]
MPDWTLNPNAVDSLGTCEASLTSSCFNNGQVGTHSPTLWHLQHGSSMWLRSSLFICLTLHCCNIKTSCLYSSLCASFAPGNSPPPATDSAAGLTSAHIGSCCGTITLNFCCHSLRSCSTVERSPGLHLAAALSFTIRKVSLTSGVFTTLAVRTLSQLL